MKEGVVDKIKIYYRLNEGIRKEEISEEEYNSEIEKWYKLKDTFTSPEVDCDTKYMICLDDDDVMGIASLLDWDIRNNKTAMVEGEHPVSGLRSGKHNEICIERNKRWIKLLGGEVDEL